MKFKVLWLTMIFMMIFSTSVLADSPGSFGLTEDDNLIIEQTKNLSVSDDFLSPEEYEAVLEEIRQKAEAEITSELKAKVEEIRKELNNSEEFQDSNKVSPMATYDSVMLEAVLSRNDGLSVTDIAAIGWTHANKARDEAKQYTDTGTEMKRDAYRHMIWNFYSLKGVGEHKTRVATINHEWAEKILPEVNRYEQAQFDSLYKSYWPYLSVSEIRAMAKVQADAYAITYRDGLIASSKRSVTVFNSTFDKNSYIMDFWNNKVGRDYAKSHPSSLANTVFTTAWNANKLIKNESNTAVSSSIRATVHANNWWYIN